MSRSIRFAWVLALGLLGGATQSLAVPDDQPPLNTYATTPNFSYVLRRGQPATTHYMPSTRMFFAANALDRNGSPAPGNPLGYHPGYTGRGFRAPYFSGGSNDVVFWDCGSGASETDCDNGFATGDQILMPTHLYADRGESCIRLILGHELFHHIEFGYAFDGGGSAGSLGSAVIEGQARALQDKIYFDLDLDPDASCIASFRGQANSYLKAPNKDVFKASYSAALFWTYLMEQYGEYPFEPGRGIDFLVNWWDLAETRFSDADEYAITEDAIQITQPTHTVVGAFHDFMITNVMKDLDLSTTSSTFRNRYSYRDEEPVPLHDNKMAFDNAAMGAMALLPANGTPVNETDTAQHFGAVYDSYDLSQCPAGSQLKFNIAGFTVFGDTVQQLDGMFALIAVQGSAPGRPAKLYKVRSKAWQQEILQPADPYERLIVAVAGWHSAFNGGRSLRCLPPPPPPALGLVSNTHPMHASGGGGGAGKVSMNDFHFTQSSNVVAGNYIGTLAAEQVQLTVPGYPTFTPAALLRKGDGYRAEVAFPTALSVGTHNLQITVGDNSTTIPGGLVVEANRAPDIVLAIDTSSSMGSATGAGRLDAAKSAGRDLLIGGLPPTARVALVRFAGDSAVPANNATVLVPLAPLSSAQRNALIAALDGLVPSAEPRIKLADLVVTSIDQMDSNGVPGAERHLVVFTDSGDATASNGNLQITQLTSAGVRAHFIALGASADQPLLARIGHQSGGGFNFVAADNDPSGLGLLLPAVQKVRAAAEGQQTLQNGVATAQAGGTASLFISADPAVVQSCCPHVKVFSGISNANLQPGGVRLYYPDGSEVMAGSGVEIVIEPRSFAFRVPGDATNPRIGTFRLEVAGSSTGSITFGYGAAVVDPARRVRLTFSRPGGDEAPLDFFRRGEPVLIQLAVMDVLGAAPPAEATALIKQNGALMSLGGLNMNDSGNDGDMHAGDGIYSAIFRDTDSSAPTGFVDSGAGTGSLGSYDVTASAVFPSGGAGPGLTLQAIDSFAVVTDNADADTDAMPDRYEVRQACLNSSVADASGDPDRDAANSNAEYLAGTDPCTADSDDGGETDGSEIAAGANPNDPNDDALPRIRVVEIERQQSEHVESPALPPLASALRFGSSPFYATVLIQRAPSDTGPFADLITIPAPAANGRYLDGGLTAGQNYCYRLIARSASNRVAAPSDTVCAVARAESTAPTGSLVVNGGAPRTANPLLSLQLGLYNEVAGTTQMNLRYPDGSSSGWVPYAPATAWNASALGAPATATFSVVYRDAAGNESMEFVDDIDVIPVAQRGRIPGKVNINAIFGTGPLADVAVIPDAGNEPSVRSIANGDFMLDDLPAGTYALTFEKPGYITRVISNIVVPPGATVSVGVVELTPEVIFRNGFD